MLAPLRARLAPAARTDGQLLAAFVDRHDPDAFAALVHRLGPRVLAVCRRITGHTHDADDAFQAIFLVLARRAAVVDPPEGVAGWVYGVAVRTAQDARAMAARRRSRVTPVATLPDTPATVTEPPDADHLARLDAAIAKLPDALRAAVVLCELDGVSRRDAAKRLGIAEGTLSSRLASARKRLAAMLGAKPPAVVALLALSASAASGSASLFARAGRWGPPAAAGEPIPAGVPATLADRVGRIMLLSKLKPLLGATACALLLLAAGWGPLARLTAADPPVAKTEPAKPPKPVNKLLIWRQQAVWTLDPDGKEEKKLFELEKSQAVSCPVLSPDGKRLAYATFVPNPVSPPDQPSSPPKYTLAVREVGGKDVTEYKANGQLVQWSADGKELLVVDVPDDHADRGPKDPPPVPTVTVIDLATKKEATASVPAGHIPVGFAPDGKGFVTMFFDPSGKKPVLTACLVSRDGKDVKTLTDPEYAASYPKLSPDGKAVLFVGWKMPDKLPEAAIDTQKVYVQPVGGKVKELADFPLSVQVMDCCWSPDGKQIAYTIRQWHGDKVEEGKLDERETESHLIVCDADGKNAKTILSEKGKGQWHVTLSSVCWR